MRFWVGGSRHGGVAQRRVGQSTGLNRGLDCRVLIQSTRGLRFDTESEERREKSRVAVWGVDDTIQYNLATANFPNPPNGSSPGLFRQLIRMNESTNENLPSLDQGRSFSLIYCSKACVWEPHLSRDGVIKTGRKEGTYTQQSTVRLCLHILLRQRDCFHYRHQA